MSLDDILINPLARIKTAGGDVLHALKQNDAGYTGYGEAYFSWADAGAIKAWKRHMRMTMNVIVPIGKVRFVFCLDAADDFRVEEIGVDRYVRITVPPGIWFGFQGLAEQQSLVLNIANISHDPEEIQRLTLSEIKYEWN